ncbi:MAG: hypothetical protein HND56_05845 [Pseudomonadota bacterium]|nr:MAG: hypothetical protein HND56_05845 [Pseudomonadota bacterium]
MIKTLLIDLFDKRVIGGFAGIDQMKSTVILFDPQGMRRRCAHRAFTVIDKPHALFFSQITHAVSSLHIAPPTA